MQPFRTACSEHPSWREAVQDCVAQLDELPAEARLGFVYSTDAFAADYAHIVRELSEATGIPHWTGTVGIGICCGRREIYETPALAVMVCDFAEESFELFQSRQGTVNAPQGDDAALGVVHGDPRSAATPALLQELAQSAPGAYLVGGLSSSQSDYPQFADGLTDGGLSGVMFNASVGVATTLSQGCSPLGPPHTVDAARSNIVSQMDGRPALEVLNDEVGEVLARDPQRMAGYIFVGLMVTGSDTGDYVVRNLLGIDPQQGELIIGDAVQPGQSLVVCKRDGESAWEDLERALNHLQGRLHSPPRGALYFSCLGRGRYLFGTHSEELVAVQQALGDVPLVGFFANGEIAHNRLYGYTGVLTVFT